MPDRYSAYLGQAPQETEDLPPRDLDRVRGLARGLTSLSFGKVLVGAAMLWMAVTFISTGGGGLIQHESAPGAAVELAAYFGQNSGGADDGSGLPAPRWMSGIGHAQPSSSGVVAAGDAGKRVVEAKRTVSLAGLLTGLFQRLTQAWSGGTSGTGSSSSTSGGGSSGGGMAPMHASTRQDGRAATGRLQRQSPPGQATGGCVVGSCRLQPLPQPAPPHLPTCGLCGRPMPQPSAPSTAEPVDQLTGGMVDLLSGIVSTVAGKSAGEHTRQGLSEVANQLSTALQAGHRLAGTSGTQGSSGTTNTAPGTPPRSRMTGRGSPRANTAGPALTTDNEPAGPGCSGALGCTQDDSALTDHRPTTQPARGPPTTGRDHNQNTHRDSTTERGSASHLMGQALQTRLGIDQSSTGDNSLADSIGQPATDFLSNLPRLLRIGQRNGRSSGGAPSSTADGQATQGAWLSKKGMSLPTSDGGTLTITPTSHSPHAAIQPDVANGRYLITAEDPQAPTSYNFHLNLPEGSHAVQNRDGGVDIVNAGGQITQTIAPPWAKDANGQAVPTSFTVHGDTLTQHLAPTPNSVYPILADPATSAPAPKPAPASATGTVNSSGADKNFKPPTPATQASAPEPDTGTANSAGDDKKIEPANPLVGIPDSTEVDNWNKKFEQATHAGNTEAVDQGEAQAEAALGALNDPNADGGSTRCVADQCATAAARDGHVVDDRTFTAEPVAQDPTGHEPDVQISGRVMQTSCRPSASFGIQGQVCTAHSVDDGPPVKASYSYTRPDPELAACPELEGDDTECDNAIQFQLQNSDQTQVNQKDRQAGITQLTNDAQVQAHANDLKPDVTSDPNAPDPWAPESPDGTVNSSDTDKIDLGSPARRNHILYGDGTGGGHLWPGAPGKTTFPQGWSGDKIMYEVSDIVTSPTFKWVQITGPQGADHTKNGAPVRFSVIGERDGVKIKVIVAPGGEGIITAFPIQ